MQLPLRGFLLFQDIILPQKEGSASYKALGGLQVFLRQLELFIVTLIFNILGLGKSCYFSGTITQTGFSLLFTYPVGFSPTFLVLKNVFPLITPITVYCLIFPYNCFPAVEIIKLLLEYDVIFFSEFAKCSKYFVCLSFYLNTVPLATLSFGFYPCLKSEVWLCQDTVIFSSLTHRKKTLFNNTFSGVLCLQSFH